MYDEKLLVKDYIYFCFDFKTYYYYIYYIIDYIKDKKSMNNQVSICVFFVFYNKYYKI